MLGANNTCDRVKEMACPILFVIRSASHYFLLQENHIITLTQEQTARTAGRTALLLCEMMVLYVCH